MSSESEQGESTREAPLPCLTELLSCTGMEPKSQIETETGFEQCTDLQRTMGIEAVRCACKMKSAESTNASGHSGTVQFRLRS